MSLLYRRPGHLIARPQFPATATAHTRTAGWRSLMSRAETGTFAPERLAGRTRLGRYLRGAVLSYERAADRARGSNQAAHRMPYIAGMIATARSAHD